MPTALTRRRILVDLLAPYKTRIAAALLALVIAAGMAASFTILVLLCGPALYRLLGGQGESLENAVRYSNVVFAGAITVWIANTLSSVLRGTGDSAVIKKRVPIAIPAAPNASAPAKPRPS